MQEQDNYIRKGPSQDLLTRKLGPSVRICQLNVEGISKAKCDFLSKFLLDNNIDVLLLQETHTKSDDEILKRGRIKGFEILGATHSQFYGTATYIRRNIEHAHLIAATTDNSIHTVIIKVEETTIVNVYKPPNQPWPTNILPALNHPTIFAGDFNSHHEQWNYTGNDENGIVLADWAEVNNLHPP